MLGLLSAFAAGIIFALGLGLGGMTDPAAILAFLDVAGPWNPNLLFVMAGGVLTAAVGYRLIGVRLPAPLFATRFVTSLQTDVDLALVIGSTLFGIGWGMVGFCPGPAIVALTFSDTMTWVFFGSMLLGMLIHRLLMPTPAKVIPSPPLG